MRPAFTIPQRRAVFAALAGHEGIKWDTPNGCWECRCGVMLTALMTPARAEDALEPWRAHIALLLGEVE